ncbi:hypothetical protein H7846_12455 [Edaphobacter sp. 4G125]|nr:hypothetical protein H7846_12455 [Edaphobacter sp. 4G125]
MDSLAMKGVTFATHYCGSLLCVPSCSSLTAGKVLLALIPGIYQRIADADMPTLPRILDAAATKAIFAVSSTIAIPVMGELFRRMAASAGRLMVPLPVLAMTR